MAEVARRNSTNELVLLAHKRWKAHEDFVEGARKKGEANRVAIGMILLELRTRIEAGEEGEISWWQWYGQKFARSRQDAQKLMDIASADDPAAAHEVAKAVNRQAVAAHRARTRVAYIGHVSDKNKPAKSTKVVSNVVQIDPPPPPDIDYDLAESTINMVRKMNRPTRLYFVTKLKKVYRE
jgi:hypothetical protein